MRLKMTAFKNPEFENFRMNLYQYQRGSCALAPPQPAGMSLVLSGGSGSSEPKDYPLHPLYGSFCQALQTLADRELTALYMVYFGAIWRGGRRQKVSAIATEHGVCRARFYEIAHKTARETWVVTKRIHARITDTMIESKTKIIVVSQFEIEAARGL
jgi:hypothetical protein